MISFYSETIYVFLGLAALVYYIRKECIDDFEKIEGSLGHEWYVIKSNIWSNDVKNAVKDLYNFIEEEGENFALEGSSNPLTDVFSDSSNLRIIKNRLSEINYSYVSYEEFDDILSNFASINEILKKWYDYLLGVLIVFCFWSLIGVFIAIYDIQISGLFTAHWSLFSIIFVIFLIILYNSLKFYNNVVEIKKKIRMKKSEYSHVLLGGRNV